MSQIAPSVLIVEDDEKLCGLLSQVLSEGGREVVHCQTAGAARTHLAAQSFDLALLDIGLPDGNGLELLRSSVPAHPETRFVVMTGDESLASVLAALRGEAYDYLCKPFSTADLRDLAERWLGSGPELRIEVHSASPEWIELSLPCTRAAAERSANFVRQFKAGLPADLRDEVSECFRELVMNAVEWGGAFDPERRVRVSFLRTSRMLMYRIADPGQGFRFDHLEHAAIANQSPDPLAYAHVREAKGLRAGGLGLMIVKSRADELIYNEAQNEVVFIKYLTSGE